MGWMSRSFVERPNELRLAEQNAISRANLKSFLQLGATQESGQFDRRSVAETFCNLSAMGLGSRLSFGEWQTGTCKVRHVNCESRILLTSATAIRPSVRELNATNRITGRKKERKKEAARWSERFIQSF